MMTSAIKTAVIAALIGIVATVAAYFCGRSDGRDLERKAALESAMEQVAEIRKHEAALLAQNEKLQGDLRNEQANSKKLAAARDADIDAGRLRLTVAVRGTGEYTAAEPGQARAELEPAFAKSLFAITDEGDAAIRELNYCIDAYEAVRASPIHAGFSYMAGI